MKQLLQDMRTGDTIVADVPTPKAMPGGVLVQSAASLVSAGTERMVVEFAEKNLLLKARSRPDLVRQTLDKVRRDGFLSTLEAVGNRLARPMALGYSCAGTVIDLGTDVTRFKLGDRVACAGGGYAVHAEVVAVPTSLVVKLPENVAFDSAAFSTLGAVAVQGIRLAEVKLGEVVAVIGLGLLGQLTVQILKAAGCTVVGMDIRSDRVKLAARLGADSVATTPADTKSAVGDCSFGRGADAVLITADTKSNQPIQLAGEVARDKGIVVAVGAVGMQIPRKIYYKKELNFRISRSYGPGRYDQEYEEKGHDYPIGYVRWTENRNMQAFVQLLVEGKVDVNPLITHRFPLEEAPKTYELITGKTGNSFLAGLILYSEQPDVSSCIELRSASSGPKSNAQDLKVVEPRCLTVGLLGAGNFATTTLLPAIRKVHSSELVGVCTATGLSSRYAGRKFGFRYCTTDEDQIFSDSRINSVVIATRHHLHGRQVLNALAGHKHVFCEKPLALNEEELRSIVEAYKVESSSILTVDYNRRFAPMAQKLKRFLADVHERPIICYRINAGDIPPGHWVHDPDQGGGRIIGEVCHFVDFLIFLVGALPVRIHARALPNNSQYNDDNVITTLEFSDGALGTIVYVAQGDKSFPKERVEVFGGGVAVLDDFRRLELVRDGRRRAYRSRLRKDKGHQGAWEAFLTAVKHGGPLPIPFEEIVATSLTTFSIVESLKKGIPLDVAPMSSE